MKVRGHTSERIVCKRREVDLALGEGMALVEVCKHLEFTEQTDCR